MYELIKKKILSACIQLLLAKRREAVHFINMCSEFQSIADFCVHLSGFGPCSKILPKLP